MLSALVLMAGSCSDAAVDTTAAPTSPQLAPKMSRDTTHLILTFRRGDEAVTFDPVVEYGTRFTGLTKAAHGQNGVVITVDDDFFGTDFRGIGIDRVTVRIPHSAVTRLFARLAVGN